MAAPLNQVFFPSTFQELFSAWGRFPGAVPYAGGTGIIRGQGRQTLELPPVILSLDKLEDLQRISRSERYLEIGAMVKLSQIIRLGKIVPEALSRCLENIAGAQLRNIATIGGNICYPAERLDASAAFTALDAQYELRSAQSSRWISASRFSSLPGPTALNPQELLTRVRVPLDQWNYSVYKKFSGSPPGSGCGVVVFLVKNQKNALTDIRVVYKTAAILRDKNSEAILAGKQLPLSRRVAAEFVENWEIFLSGIQNLDELSQKELLNFIELNVYNLTE
ncbi:MAG: FAD binding domain-containing protein [Treponema sp.]|jgi:CO/xanthine dehydrogenase FAD-binding subunit|nr:FAD binding domain-containing protein [Treponema sp.]